MKAIMKVIMKMNNQRNGSKFEGELKKILNDNGIFCLNLGYNETADLIIVNGKTRLIECKTTHKPIWYRKNPKQYYRLMEFVNKGKSVYIAIKFIINRKSIIKFFYLKEAEYPYSVNNGYTLNDFINHCKVTK